MALKLPRLQRLNAIVDKLGLPTLAFVIWWNAFAKAIEDAFNALEDVVVATAAAQAAADAANTAAAGATAATETITAEQSLINSYVTGLTLGATDAGTDATITVSAHTRVYGDGSSLAVGGGSITALAYSTKYYVYYVDPTRADTTPSYLTTASPATAAQTGDTHLVGSVTTPASGGAAVDGATTRPPGVGTLSE